MVKSDLVIFNNKRVPKVIAPQAKRALSYYPELKDARIDFKFKKNIKKSTMQAQPKFTSIFKTKKNRGYVILISQKFHIENDTFHTLDVEDNIMIGWLGHELGHVMDYKNRSTLGMLILGFKYLFSKNHIREVERAADTFAVNHGMGDYILATKNFILNNSEISPEYKARIKRLYLSPEEIMEILNEGSKEELKEKLQE